MPSVKKYYVCDTATGSVKTKLSRLVSLNLATSERLVKHDDITLNDYFFDASVMAIVPRKHFSMGEMVGNEYRVLLPQGTKLLWQGANYVINDGIAELNVDQPGQHKLTLIHPHYHTEVRTVENTDTN